MENLLKALLLIPRRIYDGFLRFKANFQQGNWAAKIKVIFFLILALLILIPLAAFGFMLFLALLTLSFIMRLFISPPRSGPPSSY
ncbi:MAG: hypothetical protein ACK5LE_06750 [Alphaproteobacteria bacterium]